MPKRKTSQRQAIRQVFEDAKRPLSVAEVLEAAQLAVDSIGPATIYRGVNALLEDGFLVAVHLPEAPARYELADLAHHHHFHCGGCGKVFDVEGCPGDMADLCPSGFELTGHEVILYGRCDTCVRKA